MMKTFVVLLLILFIVSSLFSNPVINEIMVDPIGSDTGFEWIEIYNPTENDIDLLGWEIQSGGSEFSNNFTFPHFILKADSFVTVGENLVEGSNFICNLDFQNGGSSTDGVRIMSPDGLYTDTILYDSPNINSLPDDLVDIGTQLLSIINSGHTYARKTDGCDTNNITDWQDCSLSTFNSSNNNYIDFKVTDLYVDKRQNMTVLHTIVHNLSTIEVDNSRSYLEVLIDGISIDLLPIPNIPQQSSQNLCTFLHIELENVHSITVFVYIYKDINLVDNRLTKAFLFGSSPIIISEFMYDPNSSCPEWVELFNRSDSTWHCEDWEIHDTSNSRIRFTGDLAPNSYTVISNQRNALLEYYSDIEPELVIQCTSWTYLNNSGDKLVMRSKENVIFDSLSYLGDNHHKGHSLERIDCLSDSEISWQYCTLPQGATPTRENSVESNYFELRFRVKSIILKDNHLEHELFIENKSDEIISNINLDIYFQQDNFSESLINSSTIDDLNIGEEKTLLINTELVRNCYSFFRYELTYEACGQTGISTCSKGYLDNFLPFVINEIMYNPLVNEPEWVEIRINESFDQIDSLWVICDKDSIRIPLVSCEYIILTGSKSDSTFLKANYELDEIPVFHGLPSLSNNGETLLLKDKFGNLIESFLYLPIWSKTKGVSIERISPTNRAIDNNWGSCKSFHTIGAVNSIFQENIVTDTKLTIYPNPFSPYRSESCIITYQAEKRLRNFKGIIFDFSGREIKQLIGSIEGSSKGVILWDGKNSSLKPVLPGLYVLYLEGYSEDGKQMLKKQYKIYVGY